MSGPLDWSQHIGEMFRLNNVRAGFISYSQYIVMRTCDLVSSALPPNSRLYPTIGTADRQTGRLAPRLSLGEAAFRVLAVFASQRQYSAPGAAPASKSSLPALCLMILILFCNRTALADNPVVPTATGYGFTHGQLVISRDGHITAAPNRASPT